MGGFKFRRQVPIGPYIADFACLEAMLVVEVDGESHGTPNEKAHDEARTHLLHSRGFHVYRAFNVDIYQNLTGVLEAIGQLLQDTAHENPPH
ncbi:MAG: endonuclease domain-containing protein [Pseudomonadota bacterium]